MRTFTTITAAAALFSGIVHSRPHSAPVEVSAPVEARQTCLTLADADHLVNGFAELINSTFSTSLAADILADNFTDYSDSIDFLTGATLGTATFTSLAQFDTASASQAPVPLQVLSIDAVSCTNIAWRWLAYPGSEKYEVKGINIIYAVQGNGSANGWQIGTNFAEFNVAAWVLDIGGTCVAPPPPSKLFKKE